MLEWKKLEHSMDKQASYSFDIRPHFLSSKTGSHNVHLWALLWQIWHTSIVVVMLTDHFSVCPFQERNQ